jgi:hypothetical protein
VSDEVYFLKIVIAYEMSKDHVATAGSNVNNVKKSIKFRISIKTFSEGM